MHEILIRFRFVKTNKILECYMDERLGFKENFKLLDHNEDIVIYDPNKKIFLDQNIPIKNFNISGFMLLNVFD